MREYRDAVEGMATFVNRSSDAERSDKSLILGENCTMRRRGVLEPRDGCQLSAAMASPVNTANVLLPCPKEQNAALISHSGTGQLTRYTPSTNTWTAYASGGAFSGAPVPYGDYEFDGSRVLASFYDGVVEIGALANPYACGVEPGKWQATRTDPQAVSLIAGTFIANNRRVLVKVTYVFKDFNNVWQEGAPSTTWPVENKSGGSQGIRIKASWPKTVNVSGARSWRIRVYCSSFVDVSVTATNCPNDAYYYQVYESADYAPVQTGFATIDLAAWNDGSTASLYTNADQAGAGKGRFRPPRATTIKQLGEITYYTGFAGRGRPSYLIRPKAGQSWADSPVSGVTMQFVSGSSTVNLTVGTITSAQVGQALGMTGAGTPPFPDGAYIQTFNSSTQFVMSANATANTTIAINLWNTVSINGTRYSVEEGGFQTGILVNPSGSDYTLQEGLVALAERINSDASNGVTAVVSSENATSVKSGVTFVKYTGVLIESDVPSVALTVSATSNSVGEADVTDLNAFPNNQILYSEAGMPYAVPLLNLLTVGSPNSTPSGIGIYKEVAYIFQMGRIYSLTGTDESSLSLLETDQEYYVQSQQGIAVGELGCYAYSNKGIIRVGQGGVEVISNMVTDLLPYWGTLAYNKEQRELICIPNAATTAWMVYSERTGMWTKMIPPLTTAGAMPSSFKVIHCWEGTPLNGEPYLAYSDTAVGKVWVQPERTVQSWDSFTGTVPTVSAWSSPTLTLSSTTGLAPGYVLARTNGGNTEWAVIESVDSSTVVTVRTLTTSGPGFSAGGALSVYAGFQARVRFQPFDMTDASNTYGFTEIQLLLQRHAFDNSQLIVQTDLSTSTESLDLAETGEVNAFWRLRKFNKATSSPFLAPQDDYEPWDDWGGRWLRALTPSNGRQGSQIYVEWDVNCAFHRWRLLGVAMSAADMLSEFGRRTGA